MPSPNPSPVPQKVELGYLVSPEYTRTADLAHAIVEQQRVVSACRDLGFTSVMAAEHFSRSSSVWFPPLMLLPRLLDSGEGMKFGTTILSAGLHNPVVLAEQAAFLDVATGGRFTLGLGAGWNAAEFASLGAPMSQRGQGLTEAVSILRALWGEGLPEGFSGKVHDVPPMEMSLKPLQKDGPAIWLGGGSDAALVRAAEIADTWVASSHMSLEAVESQARTYEREVARVGRELPSVRPALKSIHVGTSKAAAIEEVREPLVRSYKTFGEWGLFRDVLDEADRVVDLALSEERAVIGGPSEVAEDLIDFVRRTGSNLILVRAQWLGLDYRKTIASLERLATEVLPEVNKELARTSSSRKGGA